MNQIPVSKLTDLGMLRGNEAALSLQSQPIRSPEPQEIGGSQCDLPQHHCYAHLVFVFWSLRENGFWWFCFIVDLGFRFSQVKRLLGPPEISIPLVHLFPFSPLGSRHRSGHTIVASCGTSDINSRFHRNRLLVSRNLFNLGSECCPSIRWSFKAQIPSANA